MSRKRSVTSDISTDPKLALVAEEYGALPLLLYTWAIPHANDYGQICADPTQFRLLVCPALPIKSAAVAEAIAQLTQAGMWRLEEGDGRTWLQFPEEAWFRHQSYIPVNKRPISEHSASNGTNHRETPQIAEDQREVQENSAKPLHARVSPSPSPTLSPSPTPLPPGESQPSVGVAAGKPPRPANSRENPNFDTAPVWEAYRAAYFALYRADPVRNVRVNAQLLQFVGRVGADAAACMAAWFLTHRNAWYVKQKHSIGCLLQDCEKLHTEWKTGVNIHDRDAREVDRMSANEAMVQRIERRHEERNGGREPPPEISP